MVTTSGYGTNGFLERHPRSMARVATGSQPAKPDRDDQLCETRMARGGRTSMP